MENNNNNFDYIAFNQYKLHESGKITKTNFCFYTKILKRPKVIRRICISMFETATHTARAWRTKSYSRNGSVCQLPACEPTPGLTALEIRQLAEVRHGLRVLRGDRRLGPTQIPRVVQCASVQTCVGIKTARDAHASKRQLRLRHHYHNFPLNGSLSPNYFFMTIFLFHNSTTYTIFYFKPFIFLIKKIPFYGIRMCDVFYLFFL